MGLVLNHHLEVGGHNFVLVVAFALAAFYCRHMMRLTWEDHHTLTGIINHATHRFLFGFLVMAVGVVIRIGGWIGWRPLLYADNKDAADQYSSLSILWTGAGEVFAVTGLVIMAWPVVKDRMGKHALVKAALLTAATWWTGVLLTYVWSLFF